MDINNEPMINEEINDREVRLVGSEGEQLGVMPTRTAMFFCSFLPFSTPTVWLSALLSYR